MALSCCRSRVLAARRDALLHPRRRILSRHRRDDDCPSRARPVASTDKPIHFNCAISWSNNSLGQSQYSDAATAPVWMVWDEPIAKAPATVAATSCAGTTSVRRCPGRSRPGPNKGALSSTPKTREPPLQQVAAAGHPAPDGPNRTLQRGGGLVVVALANSTTPAEHDTRRQPAQFLSSRSDTQHLVTLGLGNKFGVSDGLLPAPPASKFARAAWQPEGSRYSQFDNRLHPGFRGFRTKIRNVAWKASSM